MRITNNMLISNMMRNLNSNLRRLDKYQTQMSTGKRIQKPSDDPVRASRALRLRTDLSRLEQYEKNSDNALSWIEITESAVAEVGDVLQRARELTVRAATGTLGVDDKQKIADEMKQLKEQLISSGNTNYAGRYIFSGYKTDSQLFDKDGNYNIDITSSSLKNKPTTSVEIGVGEEIQVSTNGLDIFQYEEINPVISNITVGSDDGNGATQAMLQGDNGAFDFGFDFTTLVAGDTISIDIIQVDEATGATTLSTFNFNETDFNTLDGTTTPIAKEDILNIIRNGDDGSGNTLGSVADVYFDIENKLVIKNKSFGEDSEVDIKFTGVFKTPFGFIGDIIEKGTNAETIEILGNEVLTDGDINSDTFENTEFLITYNGESKRVSVGTLIPTPPATSPTVSDLAAKLESEIALQFGLGKIEVTANDSDADGTFSLNYTTLDAPPYDDHQPSLSVDIVRGTESTLIKDFDEVIAAMNSGDEGKIGEFLGKIDTHINRILSVRSDIGARVNRMELIQDRIGKNNLTYTDLLSKNEDADMAEVIMNLKNQENVYRASLSAGARVIQPTLIDFIR